MLQNTSPLTGHSMYLTINQFLLKEKQQTFRTGTKLIILAGSDVIVSGSCSRNRGARLSFFPKHNRHISRKFNVIFNYTFVLKTYFRHNSTFSYRKNKLYDKIILHPSMACSTVTLFSTGCSLLFSAERIFITFDIRGFK